MTMVCDRCGEAFLLSNDVKYMTPFDDELDQFESNSIVKCLAGDDKGIYSIRDETVVLCPSCMVFIVAVQNPKLSLILKAFIRKSLPS